MKSTLKPVVLGALTAVLLSTAFLTLSRCGSQTDSDGKETVKNRETVTVGDGVVEAGLSTGSKITVPPGVVAAGGEVTMEKAPQPGEFAAIAATPGSDPVAIVAKDAGGASIERATVPMTLDIALGDAALMLAPEAKAENLCVVLKSTSAKLYVWRRAALAKVDEAARIVTLQTVFFGTYQVVYCGQEALAGYADAVTQGATGAPQASFTMTFKPTFHEALGYQKACLGLVRFDGQEGQSGKDDKDKKVVMIATSEAAVTTETAAKLSFVASEIIDGREHLVTLVLQTAGSVCPFAVGDNLDELTKSLGDPKAFFAFNVDMAALKAGTLAGTLGEAGAFATDRLKVTLETYKGAFPAHDEVKSCLDVDIDDDGKTMIPVAITGGLINGAAVYEMPIARTAAAAAAPARVVLRVGDACNHLGDVTPDAATGRPYEVRVNVEAGGTAAFVATTLQIANQTPLTGNVCLNVGPKGGGGNGDQSGSILVSLAGATYPVYLPVLTAPEHLQNDLPVYDIDLRSGTCNTGTALPPLKSKPLTKPITVEVKLP